MASRAELLKQTKYAEEAPKPAFKTFTEDELRGAIKIVSSRSYAVFGYNTPEVQLHLPQIANSSYSEIDFPDPALVNDSGQPVTFQVEHGGYQEKTFSDEIRFQPTEGDAVLQYAHARGTVKLKYPLSVNTQTFTPAKLGAKALGVKINGPYVSFADGAFQVPDPSFTTLRPVRAYDAAGKQLKQHSNSETGTDNDGVERQRLAFYGNVARVEIDSVDSWAELELPYDLTPSPMLPAGHEGEDPASYQPQ
jgi:hypothetical protein